MSYTSLTQRLQQSQAAYQSAQQERTLRVTKANLRYIQQNINLFSSSDSLRRQAQQLIRTDPSRCDSMSMSELTTTFNHSKDIQRVLNEKKVEREIARNEQRTREMRKIQRHERTPAKEGRKTTARPIVFKTFACAAGAAPALSLIHI